MTATTLPNRYTYGVPDTECRYPVLLPNGEFIGHVFRWHRAWYAVPAGSPIEIRVSAGAIGKDAAAEYLCEEFDGRITPLAEAPNHNAAERGDGPAPLLHPRMDRPHNRPAALKAVRGLSDLQWNPLGGYPGQTTRGFSSRPLRMDRREILVPHPGPQGKSAITLPAPWMQEPGVGQNPQSYTGAESDALRSECPRGGMGQIPHPHTGVHA